MNKPKEFEVRSLEDFQNLVDKKYFGISEAIVESILNNLKTRKKHIHILSVKCVDENTIFDLTLEKNNFSDTLKENLKYFEEREMYEECAKINNAIKVLDKTKS
jgi:hypothetical protein